MLGVAASCWLACTTPGLAEHEASERLKVKQALAAVLPAPAAPSTGESERLQVEGNWMHFQITAVGDFSEDSARAFADYARRLRILPVSVQTRLTIKIYSDAHGTRKRVGTFEIDHRVEVERALREHLPLTTAAKPPVATRFNVSVSRGGSGWGPVRPANADGYEIYLTGSFTSEGVKAFCDYALEFRKSLPGETRFEIHILNHADVPGRQLDREGHPFMSYDIDTANEK